MSRPSMNHPGTPSGRSRPPAGSSHRASRRGVSALALAAALLMPLLATSPAVAQVGGGQGGSGVKVLPDVEYRQVDGTTLTMDVYVPAQGSSHPGVVLVHGGGFTGGDKEWMKGLATFFAQNGFSAFAINYRWAPQFVYPAPVDDTKAAIEFVRDHADQLRLDPRRIAVFGTSAGGTIAYTISAEGRGSTSWQVAAAAGWSGGAAWTDRFDPSSPAFSEPANPSNPSSSSGDALRAYLFGTGQVPSAAVAADRARKADPATMVTPQSAPTFIAGSTHDSVPIQLGKDYASVLEQNGVPHDFLEVPGNRHGTQLGFAAREPTLQFFDQYVAEFDPSSVSSPPSGPSTEPEPTTNGPGALQPRQGSGDWLPLGIVAAVALVLLAVLTISLIRTRRRSPRRG